MSMWQKIKRWIMELLGIEPSAVKLKEPVFMPLFMPSLDPNKVSYGVMGVTGTWDFLNHTDAEIKHEIKYIVSNATKHETPAITFLLTPTNEAGNIFNPFPTSINNDQLARTIKIIKECVWNGIAVIPCLYTDDKAPWWHHIEGHQDIWKRIHEYIGRYVSGYCLSIETNEQTRTVSQLQHCVHLMSQAMPRKKYFVHLQWQGKGLGGYRWTGGISTPQNADVIVEFSWHPRSGNSKGVTGIEQEFPLIQNANAGKKLIYQEYNLEPGNIMEAQRRWMRSRKPYGVG